MGAACTSPVHVSQEASQRCSCLQRQNGVSTARADQVLRPYEHHRHPGLCLQWDLSVLHAPQQLLYSVTCMHTIPFATRQVYLTRTAPSRTHFY